MATEEAQFLILRSQTKELRKNLAADGEPEAKGCAAHHIVPKNENREWAKNDVNRSRKILNTCGINIDDAANGVYLPFKDKSQCNGANHNKLHTVRYYRRVTDLLRRALPQGCRRVQNTLSDIKSELKANTFLGGVE